MARTAVRTVPKPKTKGLGPKSVPKVVARFQVLPDDYLDCRDPGLGHDWTRLNDFHTVDTWMASSNLVTDIRREFLCRRCECVKTEHFYMTKAEGLFKYRNSYAYPEGYLLPGIPRGVTPSRIIHQEQYARTMRKVAKAAASDRETAER